MAILTDIFVAERELNHDEHERLIGEIEAFEAALESIAQPVPNINCVELRRMQRRLADSIPRHFATEEKTVLASLGRVRPEAKPFCKAMKRQHAALQRSLEKFKRIATELDFSPDSPEKAAEVRQFGLHFSRQLVQHMHAEEKKIAEFLG